MWEERRGLKNERRKSHSEFGHKAQWETLPSMFEVFGSITDTVEEIVVRALSASTHHPAPKKTAEKEKGEAREVSTGIGPHQNQTAAAVCSLRLARLRDL